MILIDTLVCWFNSALTDNGQQKCYVKGLGHFCQKPFPPPLRVELSCLDGYHAYFYLKSGVVEYSYGSFSNQFKTGYDGTYWTAKVWGC